MTIKRPRDTQLRCDDCGHTTPLTTAGMAERSLRQHSCDTVRERAARKQRRLDGLASSGDKRDCECPVANHQHGTHAAYVIDKCRCRPCRNGARMYERDRQRRHLYGKTIYVPADPAREHVRALQAQGMGWKRVARAAGLDTSILWKLLYGDPSRNMAPSKRVRPETEQAILAVKLDVAPGQKVDPTGTSRRLQALTALGWSIGRISDQTGLDRQCLDAAIHGRGITDRTRDVVAAAYDRLWNQAPPETNQRERIAASRARKRAAINAWAPALAWDDDTIDDPNATPQHQVHDPEMRGVDEAAIDRRLGGDPVTLTRAERWICVRRLHSQGFNDGQIARQLGYPSRTILRDRQELGLRANQPQQGHHQEGTAA